MLQNLTVQNKFVSKTIRCTIIRRGLACRPVLCLLLRGQNGTKWSTQIVLNFSHYSLDSILDLDPNQNRLSKRHALNVFILYFICQSNRFSKAPREYLLRWYVRKAKFEKFLSLKYVLLNLSALYHTQIIHLLFLLEGTQL